MEDFKKVIANTDQLSHLFLAALVLLHNKGIPPSIKPTKKNVVGNGYLSKHKLINLLSKRIAKTIPIARGIIKFKFFFKFE